VQVQVAESATERLLLLRCEPLVPEEQHSVLGQGFVQCPNPRVVEMLRKVDAENLGAASRRDTPQFELR
jgi:hypothetical protein